MEYNQRLAELKRLILLKSGIKFITPADCKRISIEISRQLNKNVSETTIKRLFGFAVVKHRFSNFTLTTLAEYVYADDIKNGMLPERDSRINGWNAVKDKAAKITDFTLKTIRNRSGIPYEMTISRRYAEHDFDDFYQSGYLFTSLVSQPGYGKTTLLCHLAENLFLAPNARYKTSTLLFLQAYNFFNLEQLNINLDDQIKSQLQIDTEENTLDYIQKQQTKQGGKFIIILDGLSDLVLKKEQKDQLFDSIINLICALEGYKNIRLILSMRSTTWVRFHDRTRQSTFLQSSWYRGHYFSMQEITNVPALSEKEVELIISKINHMNDKSMNSRLKSQLKFPFHIHLYYQLKEEDPDFNYYSNITFFELASRFIQEKIYRANYYTEKILFLKRVIQLTAYGKDGNSVAKDNLLKELSTFKNAYMELIADGILMEEKRFEDELTREYVRFLHTHMFEYFLFVEILEKFYLQINKDFFEYINAHYDSHHSRFQLLQWTVRFLIKTGNFEALKSLFLLDLNIYEINYLILFIAEEIKYRSKYNPGLIKAVDESNFHRTLITELFNFDFIDQCFRDAVYTLIHIATKDEHLMIYNAMLGIIDMLAMNTEEVKVRIDEMDKLVMGKWTVNPLEALNIIYASMAALPISSFKLMAQIEALKNGENLFRTDEGTHPDIKQGISYMLILFVSFFTGNNSDNIQLIEVLTRLKPELFKRNSFAILMLNIYDISISRINNIGKADHIEKILVNLSNDSNITKYQETILLMHQSQQLLNRKDAEAAAEIAKECLTLFKQNAMIFDALACYDLLIKIAVEMKDNQVLNDLKVEKKLMLNQHHIPESLFMPV